MPLARLDPLDRRLLSDFQHDFPLVAAPFADLAERLGTDEATLLGRLDGLVRSGAVSRVGAACRPHAIGASTLAAVAAPDWQVEPVAAAIVAEPGVNHLYLREHRWNLWFVATGPDAGHVARTLGRIGAATGLDVLELPLECAYHIDLGFPLDADARRHDRPPRRRLAAPVDLDEADRELVQCLIDGLPLVPRPFAALAAAGGTDEAAILQRIQALDEAGVFARIGIIVRHRAVGWRANAMVAFAPPVDLIDRMGTELAADPAITLCYRRRVDPERWPFPLFCMVHGRSREAALADLTRAVAAAGMDRVPRRILFSLRCFKQTGALVSHRERAA